MKDAPAIIALLCVVGMAIYVIYNIYLNYKKGKNGPK